MLKFARRQLAAFGMAAPDTEVMHQHLQTGQPIAGTTWLRYLERMETLPGHWRTENTGTHRVTHRFVEFLPHYGTDAFNNMMRVLEAAPRVYQVQAANVLVHIMEEIPDLLGMAESTHDEAFLQAAATVVQTHPRALCNMVRTLTTAHLMRRVVESAKLLNYVAPHIDVEADRRAELIRELFGILTVDMDTAYPQEEFLQPTPAEHRSRMGATHAFCNWEAIREGISAADMWRNTMRALVVLLHPVAAALGDSMEVPEATAARHDQSLRQRQAYANEVLTAVGLTPHAQLDTTLPADLDLSS